MAEQLLSRRPESNRTTRKVEPISLIRPNPPWYQRVVMLILIAGGGAVVGHLGSQLTSRLLSGRSVTLPQRPGGVAPSLLSAAPSLSERLIEIDQHLSGRDFGTALLLCDEALTMFPSENQVLVRRQHAEDELHNRFRYQMFEQAATRRNYTAAVALYNEIPADSTYKLRAMQELPALRSHIVGEKLSSAQTAAKLGECSEARLYAGGVLAIDGASLAARAVLEQCPATGNANRAAPTPAGAGRPE
jgi:hypothetical protein